MDIRCPPHTLQIFSGCFKCRCEIEALASSVKTYENDIHLDDKYSTH
jgi:hypothetical protein